MKEGIPAFLACAMMVNFTTGPAAAERITKCLDGGGKVLYTQGACPTGMRRAGEVAPPPPPASEASRKDRAKVFESKPAPDKATPDDDRKNKNAEKKRDKDCQDLAEKLARLQDKRSRQGRQGYTQKERDGLDADIREIEAKRERERCR